MSGGSNFHAYLNDQQARLVFSKMWQIAGFIYDALPMFSQADLPDQLDGRRNMPNPEFRQTTGGLYMSAIDASDCLMWTPWGEWLFGAGDAGDRLINVSGVLDHIKADWVEQEPLNSPRPTWMYKIEAVDGILLPEPRLMPPSKFMSAEASITAWRLLRYELTGT